MGLTFAQNKLHNRKKLVSNTVILCFLRVDRDIHVKIYKENVRFGFENQFVKVEEQYDIARNTPYDYLSIMHYGKTAFSKWDSQVRNSEEEKQQNEAVRRSQRILYM